MKNFPPNYESVPIGTKINKLTVLGEIDGIAELKLRFPNISETQLYNIPERFSIYCQCECGDITILSKPKFLKGKCKDCGCNRRQLIKERTSIKKQDLPIKSIEICSKAIYTKYKNSARKRFLDFELTLDELSELLQEKCYYCESSPSNVVSVGKHQMVYNGIDRIDNCRGYVFSNSVACCWLCNSMKGNRSYDEFLKHMTKIIRNLSFDSALQVA